VGTIATPGWLAHEISSNQAVSVPPRPDQRAARLTACGRAVNVARHDVAGSRQQWRRAVKGFKDFMLRGNVAGLAVAFVIGGAFGVLVQGFVKDFITPLIAIPGGGGDFASYTFTVGHGTFRYGDFLDLLIAFVLVAAAVYFALVLPMQKLEARRASPATESTTRPCPECLSNIPLAARRCSFCTSPVSPSG
jgi:large conductance mechanosensitive channel